MSADLVIAILLLALAWNNYVPRKEPSKFWASTYLALALVYFIRLI